jgi:hypothetical protein
MSASGPRRQLIKCDRHGFRRTELVNTPAVSSLLAQATLFDPAERTLCSVRHCSVDRDRTGLQKLSAPESARRIGGEDVVSQTHSRIVDGVDGLQ